MTAIRCPIYVRAFDADGGKRVKPCRYLAIAWGDGDVGLVLLPHVRDCHPKAAA